MSGHNRWSKIKHKKAAMGNTKGRLFTKLIKEITVAARMGGGDPDGNARLRSALIEAKAANMPSDTITRAVKKTGKLYIRIFPDKPVTKKPAETRMGKGKGANEGYVAVVKPGRVLFELEGVDEKLAREAFTHAHHKLPIKTQIISREPML